VDERFEDRRRIPPGANRIEQRGAWLEIEVAAAAQGVHRFDLIGAGGRVLAVASGRKVRLALPLETNGYVRVVVTDSSGRHAWLQPIRLHAGPGAVRAPEDEK
jgi:hypothetical protein